jgi:hypothetical protein
MPRRNASALLLYFLCLSLLWICLEHAKVREAAVWLNTIERNSALAAFGRV